jgi:hypothetical protein
LSITCVSLFKEHPRVIIIIIMLFRRDKVPREKFAQHAAAFEHQIVTFLEWQQQAGFHLYDACLLPHELCALIVAYRRY